MRILHALAVLLVSLPAGLLSEIVVNTDFPGGSGEVVSLDQEARVLILNPTDHPERGWRCWWYVRLTGLQKGITLTLDVGDAPWATPDQATVSVDRETWKQTSRGVREGKRIRYSIAAEAEAMWVAWGPPFVPADGEKLVRELSDRSPEAEAFSLCRTREGRDTPALRVAPGSEAVGRKPLVWVQARQHAWESGSSWVGKGFAEWLVSEDPAAIDLRHRAEIVFVPIMDIDNVHRGAGGKSQRPQDHNRDWSEDPHWNAVRAAQQQIRAAASEERLVAFIDLHNPGAGNRFPYFYVPPKDILTEAGYRNEKAFLSAAKAEITGPLRFTGQAIESGSSYDPRAWKAISKNWVAMLGTDAVSVTLETAWNTPASTTEGYLTVGRQLGRALQRYLVETK